MKVIVTIALLLALALADTCGGNCPSGKCPTCPCGSTKNVQDIATWCAKYSWNQACCKCIVSHESSGNAHATGYNTNGSYDVGLWQINNVSKYGDRLTGEPATAGELLATQHRTSTAPSRFTLAEAIRGLRGRHILLVAADLSSIHQPLYHSIQLLLAYIFL